jgi:peptide/nickel transport system substrate-binding protein
MRRLGVKGFAAGVIAILAVGIGVLFPNPARSAAMATLVVDAADTPQGLDREFNVCLECFEVIGNVYESLLRWGRKEVAPGVSVEDYTKIVPALATRWEVSTDGRSAVFHLRRGATSHAGNEFTAQDWKWSLERAAHLNGVGGFQLRVWDVEMVSAGADCDKAFPVKTPEDTFKSNCVTGVQVLDKYSFKVTTVKPNPLLIPEATNVFMPVFDSKDSVAHATDADPWATKYLATHGAGWGPYSVARWAPGQEVVLEADPHYFRGSLPIKTVIYKAVPSSATRLTDLLSGQADLAERLDARQIRALQGQSGVTVADVKGNYEYQIEMNSKMAPFDNKLVRQAFSYAAPYEAVIKDVFLGLARQENSPIADIYPNWTGQYWHYGTDLDKAKQLLQQAKFDFSQSVPLYYDAGSPYDGEIAILVQSNLAKIGVNVQLNKTPTATYYAQLVKRAYPFFFFFDSAFVPDPGYNSFLYMNSRSFVDYANYQNAEVDRLIEAGLQTIDPTQRREIYFKVQQLIVDDAPWIFLVQPGYQLAMRANVHGFVWYTWNGVRFSDFSKR